MPLKILIINLHSSRNAGDASLTDQAVRLLEEQFPACTFTLAANHPESYAPGTPVVASFGTWFKDSGSQRFRWHAVPGLFAAATLAALIFRLTRRQALFLLPQARRPLVRAYLEADLVVSSPGGFLFSSRSGLGLVNSLFTMFYAVLAGKPLYLMPQSIGPIEGGWLTRLARWVLNQARVVMVREAVSLRWLETAGVNRPPRYELPDPAFGLAPGPREAAAQWLQERSVAVDSGRPRLGLTVLDWEMQSDTFRNQEQFEAALAAAARWFVEQCGGDVVVFPQVSDPTPGHDDRVPARRIAERLGALGPRVTVIEDPAPYPLLKACYGWMDVFVGTRMHSNIFALTERVPVLAVAYLPKSIGIMRTAGLERWLVMIEAAQGEAVQCELSALWDERQAVREHLARTIPKLAEQAGEAGRLIREDFETYRRGAHA